MWGLEESPISPVGDCSIECRFPAGEGNRYFSAFVIDLFVWLEYMEGKCDESNGGPG